MPDRRALTGVAACAALAFLSDASRAEDLQTLLTGVRADATIDSISGDLANGAGEFLLIGREPTGRERRALLYFAVHEAIPPGSVVLDASIGFRLVQGAASIELWRVTQSWREGRSDPAGDELTPAPALPRDVTWTYRNYGALAAWTTPGGALAAQASGGFSVSGSEILYTVSLGQPAVVADVQRWIDHPDENHGWCLAPGGTGAQLARLESKENAGTYAPHLWVRYYLPGLAPQTYCTSTVNSSGNRAVIGAYGSTSWAANDLHLTVTGAPPNAIGAFFCGPLQANVPFGNGVLCVDSSVYAPIQRLGTLAASPQGTVDRALDFLRAPDSVIQPSSLWRFQFWFRDPGVLPAGFNLSDGLFVVVYP